VIGRLAAAQVTAASERITFEPPQYLLDIEAGDRTLAAGKGRAAVQGPGQLVNACTRTIHVEGKIALAFNALHSQQLIQALSEIAIYELQLRLERGAGR